MSMNKVILIGNLGADPEIRTTASGTVVANVRLATSERVKRGDNWEDHTEWHRVVAFGRTAETIDRFCQKGKQIAIEGRLRTSSYEKDGVTKWSTEIICDRLTLLGRKSDGDSGGNYSGGGQSRGGGGYGGGNNNGGGSADDDIPF